MNDQPAVVAYTWEEGPGPGRKAAESALAAYSGALGGSEGIWRSVIVEHGPLGLCSHGVPFTHSWGSEFIHTNVWDMAQAEFTTRAGHSHLCLPTMAESIPALEAWTRFFAELATQIARGSSAPVPWPDCADINQLPIGPQSVGEALALGFETLSPLEAQVRALWGVADVSARFGLDEDGRYRVRMSRVTTFAELAFLAVANGAPEGSWQELVTCFNCGEELSDRSGRGRDQMAWCDSEECRRARKRIYNRRYRNRQKG